MVNLFLVQFSRQLAPGVHAMLLWDNAGYHVGKELVVPANVSLIGLLPDSPELNPVENLRHYLRAHSWSHGVYPDHDALLEVATETWRTGGMDPEKVRSIWAAPYLAEAHGILLIRMRRIRPQDRLLWGSLKACAGIDHPWIRFSCECPGGARKY